MKILAALIVFALTGCAMAPITPQEQSQCGPRPTAAEAAASVQIYIGQQNWKDADSVKVRNIQTQGCVARQIGGLLNGGRRYVGWQFDFEVNAKNSFGGYTGFEPRWVLKTADGITHWWTDQ